MVSRLLIACMLRRRASDDAHDPSGGVQRADSMSLCLRFLAALRLGNPRCRTNLSTRFNNHPVSAVQLRLRQPGVLRPRRCDLERHKLTCPGHRPAKRLGHGLVRQIIAENNDPFFPQLRPCSTSVAFPYPCHVIVLLSHCADHTPADAATVYESEQLIYALLAFVSAR
ncbi:hypothetical protein SBRY_30590 [Actinacidiphila bryophytorum]|uniref:Uncharacterized protein n=1 Tax=Actinacidiphila bryophytorum TaxID=1436133 RepID=A0A9W4MGZ7_9ACTN|nr:hypothetical protein SBRY_30590 [Actinacidiphila bryophytorum]